MLYSRVFLALPLFVVCGVYMGCSGPDRPAMGYVSGTITMDGDPLEKVSIVIKPEVGRAAMGETDGKGHYEIYYTKGEKGTKVGPSTVSVLWGIGAPSTKPIPKKYAEGTSEIKLDVKKGQQTFDLNLESDPASAKGIKPKISLD